jgi:hypothetical protein
MPAIGLEALGYVFSKGDISVAFNGNIVVVVQIDKLAQAKCPRQRSGL